MRLVAAASASVVNVGCAVLCCTVGDPPTVEQKQCIVSCLSRQELLKVALLAGSDQRTRGKPTLSEILETF